MTASLLVHLFNKVAVLLQDNLSLELHGGSQLTTGNAQLIGEDTELLQNRKRKRNISKLILRILIS